MVPALRLPRSLLVVLWLLAAPAFASTWYVRGTGSDTASGLSADAAFRSLQHAADVSQPGDIIYAMDGLYTAAAHAQEGDVLVIRHGGTADKWITYKAFPGQHPEIHSKGWNAVQFDATAAYVEFNGFSITGNAGNVDPQVAIERGRQAKPVPDPQYDGNCISADGRKGTPTVKPHHLRILNNRVSDCGGGGIALIQVDYVTISGNVVFDSAKYSIYGCSGISTLESWNSDDSTGTKMVITGNRVFENRELVPWIVEGKVTDGEGIIIDTLRSPTLGAYNGRTLVANNVVYGNGSAAIEVYKSDHVDVLNNSTFHNVGVAEETGRGEMNLNDAGDVHVWNNIFVSAKGENPVALVTSKPCTCELGGNLYFGGSNTPLGLTGKSDLMADPGFRNPDLSHPFTVDLSVLPGSPALGSAVKATASPVDFLGRSRPADRAWNRGAWQQ